MTINHYGHIITPQSTSFLWKFIYLGIGKLTFPIMAYLLIEGYRHTKNIKRYILRLFQWAVISILPFHIAFQNDSQIYILNNILFTLGFGLLMVYILDKISSIWHTPVILMFTLITMNSDWNYIGILLIYLFYKNKINYGIIVTSITATIIETIGYFDLIYLNYLTMLLVIPLLQIYNHQKGFFQKLIQYGFYAYYPLHLLILVLLK